MVAKKNSRPSINQVSIHDKTDLGIRTNSDSLVSLKNKSEKPNAPRKIHTPKTEKTGLKRLDV